VTCNTCLGGQQVARSPDAQDMNCTVPAFPRLCHRVNQTARSTGIDLRGSSSKRRDYVQLTAQPQPASAIDRTLAGASHLGSAAPMVLRNTLAQELALPSMSRLLWLPCRTESTTYSMPTRRPSSGSCWQ
jgi:hypothetical protein